MRHLSFGHLHGPGLFAAALCTIALSVVDAYFTLDLVSRGAEELNPIMAYYLEKSPLIFFSVKYLLTCTTIILILSVKETCIFGKKLRTEILFACFILQLAAVVQWQLVLLHDIAGY
jgi:hypothetical protein